MEVIISTNVYDNIEEYLNALLSYPITRKRAWKKVDNMVNKLMQLGSSVFTPPICMYKDLLQTFDENGNTKDKNLRRYNYKDESGFQWAFACFYNNLNDTITILKMMPTSQIKEEILLQWKPVLDFNKRLSQVSI